MTAALELIRTVEAHGGQLRVEDGWLVIAPQDAAEPLIEELREHKAEIIRVLRARDIPAHDPAEWREPFARWMDVACVRSPRCFGGVGCLHIAFCEWATNHGDVTCTRDTFERLLEELGFLIGEVAGVVLVSGLTFTEDIQAAGLLPATKPFPLPITSKPGFQKAAQSANVFGGRLSPRPVPVHTNSSSLQKNSQKISATVGAGPGDQAGIDTNSVGSDCAACFAPMVSFQGAVRGNL
jgi:hypothetical protein